MNVEFESGIATIQAEVTAALAKNWRRFLAMGIIAILLGIIAIVTPFAASIAIEVLIGGILLAGGIFRLIHAVTTRTPGGWGLDLLTSLLSIAVGVLMLVYPLKGLLTLTILLAVFFMASGMFKIITSIQLRSFAPWGWMLASGIIALILGGIIWSELPGDAAWIIGLLVGIDLIFGGWALVMFSRAAKTLR